MRSVFFLLMASACLFALVATECTLDDIIRCEREIESETFTFTFTQYFTLSLFLIFFTIFIKNTTERERDREWEVLVSITHFFIPMHCNDASQIIKAWDSSCFDFHLPRNAVRGVIESEMLQLNDVPLYISILHHLQPHPLQNMNFHFLPLAAF